MEEFEEFPDPWWKKPLTIILAIFLIFIVVVWYIPSRAIPLDPEPRNIPQLEDVVPNDIPQSVEPRVIVRQDFPKFIDATNPIVKQTADKIVTQSCQGNRICHAKAIFYFIRDNFQYVSDPNGFEYIKSATESLASTGGDCDDASILAANLLEAVGFETRFVFIPGHVYIQAWLPEAAQRYKAESDWIDLDLTCANCEFGQLPYTSLKAQRTYV